MATTPGSNIDNFPSAPLDMCRYGVTGIPVRVLMGANGAVSTFSCPVAISVASAAASGVVNFTIPSGLNIYLVGQPAHIPGASSQSAGGWYITSRVPTAGTFQLLFKQENASGTTVSGVNPASGDQIEFVAFVHSTNDGSW